MVVSQIRVPFLPPRIGKLQGLWWQARLVVSAWTCFGFHAFWVWSPLSGWNMALGIYYNKIPLYPMFYLLKGDYIHQSLRLQAHKSLSPLKHT